MAYLISSLLAAEANPVICNTVFDMVKPADVCKEYQPIYSAMLESWQMSELIEPSNICAELLRLYFDDYDALVLTLNELWNLLNHPDYWDYYLVRTLKQIKVDKFKQLGHEIHNQASPKDIDEYMAEVGNEITTIIEKYNLQVRPDLAQIISDYLLEIGKQAAGKDDNRIKTGLYYEKYIKGFRPGDFIILAGRPKMGKSAVANTIICTALQAGKRVMLVNNEMDEQSVVNRMIANIYGISLNSLQEPEKLSEFELEQITKAGNDFQALHLHLYCFKMKTFTEVKTEAMRLKEVGTPVDFIVLDYLQLFRSGNKHNSRYEEVTDLSWQGKMMAADVFVPVLALAQLNRACEARTDKRPLPSDLRDTGSLEQDATALMFIYRDDYYNPTSVDQGLAEINVALNRNGKIGTDKYYYDFDRMRFTNLESKEQEG
jgi:replicative DNA helicase